MFEAVPPTYLSCSVEDARGRSTAIEMTIDEPNQVVTVTLPRWRLSNREPAVFSPDQVRVTTAFTTYRVNRITLAI